MHCRVCPWWAGFTIDNPLRRWIFQPDKTFARCVRPGMTVLDIGCGMGVNSLSMAKLVGPDGLVIAVDIQARMLESLQKRAVAAGFARNVLTRLCRPDSIEVTERIDFAVAFWMVHEVPDRRALLDQVRACLAQDGRFLVAEPVLHVTRGIFDGFLDDARKTGFRIVDRPHIPISHAVLLQLPS